MKTVSLYSGDGSKEIQRIDKQNEYLNKIVTPFLDDIFSNYENPLILDVGCSDGRNIMLRLKNRNYFSLLGIDKNSDKIEIAKNLFNTDKDAFVCCDINSDDLTDILSKYLSSKNKDGFDIIHISSVLLHLKDPLLLLKKMKDFLSKNGSLFIQDEDDGLNVVYPYEKKIEDCFYIWDHSIESGDRYMGRKIPFFLSECEYSDIKIYSSAITSADFRGEKKECFWDLYFNSDLWAADHISFYDDIDAYERYLLYRKSHSELKSSYMNGQYFITLGIFFISAKK